MRFEAWAGVFPPSGEGAYDVVPRVLRTEFVERWHGRVDEARAHAEELRTEVMDVVARRAAHELVPFTGQTAGLVHEVLPAGEIVERMVREAETVIDALR